MDKKYIFFDVDGTLMDIRSVMEDSTRDSLVKLREQGHEIFLATGRGYFNIPNFILELGFSGMVLTDGAYVEYNKEVLAHQTMDKSQLDALTIAIEAGNGHLMYFGRDGGYIAKRSVEVYQAWLEVLLSESPVWLELQGKVEILDSLLDITDQNIEKLMFLDYEGDLEKLKKEFSHYFTILPSNLADRSDTSTGEITRYDICKADGIERILKHIGATKKDVIAFGDGLNDIEMLELANVGVAMGNGAPQLKEVADIVTTSIGEDGIYNGLKQLELL